MATQLGSFGLVNTLYDNTLFNAHPYSIDAVQWLQNNYYPTDNEVFVVSYPKTGTTVTLQICHEIMECYYNKTKSKNDEYYKENQGHHTYTEWIDVQRSRSMETFNKLIAETKNTKRRFWKSMFVLVFFVIYSSSFDFVLMVIAHLPLNYLPFKAYPKRMIICCRNPKDVLVSFYFHFKNFRGKSQRFTGSFDTFYTLFVAGLLNGNSYFDFYRNFWSFYRQNLQSKQTEIYWSNFEDLAESEQSKRRQIRKVLSETARCAHQIISKFLVLTLEVLRPLVCC